MNKTELVAKIAEKSALSKKDAEKALAAFVDAVEEAVAGGESVQLIGFGTFETRTRGAREGRNPATGKTIKIAASNTPVFKAAKVFKEKVN